jgi:hypothetical protein
MIDASVIDAALMVMVLRQSRSRSTLRRWLDGCVAFPQKVGREPYFQRGASGSASAGAAHKRVCAAAGGIARAGVGACAAWA